MTMWMPRPLPDAPLLARRGWLVLLAMLASGPALASAKHPPHQTIVRHADGHWAVIAHGAVDRTDTREVATVRCEPDRTRVRLRRYAADGAWMVEDSYLFDSEGTRLARRTSFAQSPTVLRAAGRVRGGRFQVERTEATAGGKRVTPEPGLKRPRVPVHDRLERLPFAAILACPQ